MKYASILLASPLLSGMTAEQLPEVMQCFHARQEKFARGEFIFSVGDHTERAGIVLSGATDIIREDFWGNRSILDRVGPGEMFGEVYSLRPEEALAVSVVAAEHTEVLFLNISHIFSACKTPCGIHTRLTMNLISIMAGKNIMLTRKIDHVSGRTTRQKLLAYLSYHARRSGGAEFDVPFNRQQLADYLAVDRSAMSFELGRMKRDGLIDYQRNHFHLLSPE